MSNQIALVIEDDEGVAFIYTKAIETAGFEVEVIRDGNTALARLAVIVPHLVVLDLHLPCMEGTDILQQIRADARLAETRIIVVTGDPLAAEELQDRADLVLIKPVSFNQLHNLATRLVSAAPLDK